MVDHESLHASLLSQRCGSTAATTRLQFALLLSLFALWGACNALNDVLIRTFQQSFTLSDAESSLVQTAFYFGYLVGAMPAACFCRRFGYKACTVTGLGLVCTGSALFWPCSRGDAPWYPLLLGCLYLLAFGLAFLECSANPWVLLLGERRRIGSGTASLNLAQAVNPVGSIGGVLLGRQIILGAPPAQQVAAVGKVYLILAAVFACVALAFCCVRFPSGEGVSSSRPMRCVDLLSCLRRRRFVVGALAQFLNIGAQTCVWSFTIRYVSVELPSVSDRQASDALLLSLLLFLVGRFTSTALLRCIRPGTLLAAQCALATLCALMTSFVGGGFGCVCLVTISACFGMCFPTIFGMAMGELPDEQKEIGAAVLVMAIIGGALVPPLMGAFSDATGYIRVAYVVPALCFCGMAGYGAVHALGRWEQDPALQSTHERRWGR